MESKLAHLEMIQSVVDRHAHNSFLIKGWSIVLVSALFALAARDAHLGFAYLAYFPAAMFWVLDGYYLRQERLFRCLYDHVRGLSKSSIDFSMDTEPYEDEVESWYDVTRSKTLAIFHGTLFFSIVIVMILLSIARGGG